MTFATHLVVHFIFIIYVCIIVVLELIMYVWKSSSHAITVSVFVSEGD